MSLLIGAMTIGAILSLLALGVFVSFRVFDFPDITADGSITLGAAVAAMLLVAHVHPALATGIACVAGAVAGATTGVIHTRFGINRLLSGILVMTALYSVNLHVMIRMLRPPSRRYSSSSIIDRTMCTPSPPIGRSSMPAPRAGFGASSGL